MLALVTMALACEQEPTLRRDAGGPRDAGGGSGEDTGPGGGHACDVTGAALRELLDAAANYDAVPSAASVQRAAVELWRLETQAQVTEHVVLGIERILADTADPVHSTPDGAAYLRSVATREQARIMELTTQIEDARATAPDDVLREAGGAVRVLDAVLWGQIGDETMELLTRCADDRGSIEDGEVETFVAQIDVLMGDLEDGHMVGRRGVADDILAAAGGAP